MSVFPEHRSGQTALYEQCLASRKALKHSYRKILNYFRSPTTVQACGIDIQIYLVNQSYVNPRRNQIFI